jgi:hypothetical protein
MKVKMIGIQSKIIFCGGSGGSGLSFIWNHMVTRRVSRVGYGAARLTHPTSQSALRAV